jgi:hypothetical protein
MEILIGVLGGVASILGLALAIYAVFINGRYMREALREISGNSVRQMQALERIEQTQKDIANSLREGNLELARLIRIEAQTTKDLIQELAK